MHESGRASNVIACIKCQTRSPDMRGALCVGCATRLVCADWHVPGIVRSTIAATNAAAWLIDPWGQPHAVAPVTTIGRAAGNDIVISDRHVSAEHAELRADSGGWRLRDRGSTGGTHVGARRDVRVDAVAHLDEVQFASLAFYLWARPEPPATRAPVVDTRAGEPHGFRIIGPDGHALILRAKPGPDPRRTAGLLLVERAHARVQQPLSTLQFQLLRTLCERGVHGADATGGYVDTRELLRTLPFLSVNPQDVNVRQVVHGLRRLLEELGLPPTLLDAASRVGYRIAWRVEYEAR